MSDPVVGFALIIVGAVFILLLLIDKRPIPITKIGVLVAGIFFIAVGLYKTVFPFAVFPPTPMPTLTSTSTPTPTLTFTPIPTPTPDCSTLVEFKKNPDYCVKITNYKKGDVVPYNILLEGAYVAIPAPYTLRVIVYSMGDGLFYPWHSFPLKLDGTWSVFSYIGLPTDSPLYTSGEGFDIGLYLADPAANSSLDKYFGTNCKVKGGQTSCKGLEQDHLPGSIIPVLSIPVTRQ